jgi:signal transduction histidine kinase
MVGVNQMDESDFVLAPMKESVSPADHPIEDLVEDGEIQQLVSHFLANITNEFRTPLAALNASVEYLLDDLALLSTYEITELLGSIHLSLTGLQTLIDNLIESTNIEAGRFFIRTGAIELNAVISEAVRFTRPLISRRRQRVIVERPSSLPLVIGDPSRLTQVMVNLLSNASKFGPMNQTICVGLEEWGSKQVRVTVTDQGLSIRPEEREKLFNRSILPATSSDRPYGIDLGLAVARTIVEEHGGAIGVEDCPDGGSIFWFTIPIVRTSDRRL